MLVFDELCRTIPSNPVAIETLRRAHFLSTGLYSGKFLRSGKSIIDDCLDYSLLVARQKLDMPSIIVAMLYDVINNVLPAPPPGLDDETLNLLNKMHSIASNMDRASYLQKISAERHDVRPLLLELLACLHRMNNMHEVEHPEQVLAEARDIFVPIAHQLDVHSIQSTLDDLIFRLSEPAAYASLESDMHSMMAHSRHNLQSMVSEVEGLLTGYGITGKISERIKHLASINRKLKKSQRSHIGSIYDILGLRIIVESKKSCYRLLGIIHAQYKPVSGRFKDYITAPKANGYQSLHTCILLNDGGVLEIQIRTSAMHEEATNGLASHFNYKNRSWQADADALALQSNSL